MPPITCVSRGPHRFCVLEKDFLYCDNPITWRNILIIVQASLEKRNKKKYYILQYYRYFIRAEALILQRSAFIDFLLYFCFTSRMKKMIACTVLICSFYAAVFSQSITTASVFFAGVSEKYGGLSDYTAALTISAGTGSRTQVMNATVYFKRPNRLRIDFTKPDEQVILFTGDTLTIYIPAYRMVLSQTIEKSAAGSAHLATPQGLSLLKRSYTIAYETGADPQPLEEGSSEQVIALILNRRSAAETFRTIRILISPSTQLIRRIEAWPISGSKITFDFSNYHLNTGIPDSRFLYDLPPNASMLNNFLFEE